MNFTLNISDKEYWFVTEGEMIIAAHPSLAKYINKHISTLTKDVNVSGKPYTIILVHVGDFISKD